MVLTLVDSLSLLFRSNIFFFPASPGPSVPMIVPSIAETVKAL